MRIIRRKNLPLETRIWIWLKENTILGDAIEEIRTVQRFCDTVRWDYLGGAVRFVKNCWAWRKVLWEDRNWDFVFIYQVLAFKLRRQADQIEKHGIAVGKDKRVKEMRTCALLLDRAGDDYLINNPWYRKAEEVLGRLDMVATEQENGLTYKVDFIRGGRELTEKEDKLHSYYRKKAREYDTLMQKQDLEVFARLFCRKSRGWWD